MNAPLIINNAKILTPHGIEDGDIRVDNGLIAEVGTVSPQDGDNHIDAKGKLVTPGLIDLGVFAIDKPAFHFGGITRAALMPDQSPPLDYPSRVNYIAKSGKPDLWVHPLAAATSGLAGRELAELALMRDAGARGVATGRKWIADSGVMLRLLQYAAMLDLVVVSHAEDSGIAGEIALAEMAGAKLHLRQVTTAASIKLVREAKSRGVRVTAGVTPAHFMLSDLATAEFRTFARLSPPLRSEEDRQAVITAIGEGVIDVIASGHDPRGPEDKRLPFADAEPGMAGAETLLAMALTLVRDNVIDMERMFDCVAGKPAELLGVNAGVLEQGKEADMAIIDPERPWIVNSQKMAAAAGNTPFDGQPMQGRVTALFKSGAQIA